MRIKKLTLFFIVFSTATIMVLPSLASAQKKIKIGILAALTGPFASAEIHQRDGAVMAVDWINGKGGITIKGEKYLLEAVTEDNKCTAEGSKTATEKLVNDHKVRFICGATITYINLAAGAVTEPAKVIRAVNYVGFRPGELTAQTPYTFKVNPTVPEGIPPALDYLVEKFPKVKTFGTITPDDGNQPILFPFCEKEGQQRGLKQVSTVPWAHDTVDFYPKMTQLLAPKPDAVFVVHAFEEALVQMIKAAREMGMKGPFAVASYENPYDIVDMAGKDLTPPFFSHGWSHDVNDPQLPPEMKECIKTAEAKMGKFHNWNLWGWNEVWLIAQAIEKAQSLDTTVIADTWRKMDSLKTVYGPGKMGGEKTYGIKNAVCSRLAITEVLPDGMVKHIKWVPYYLP
jgi:branched-chain amino acid transport system substrate-binding protein